MAKSNRSDIDRMEEDMRGLDHNGLLQRQWKKLRQVLERNAEEKSPESEGHYAAKHPPGTEADDRIAEAVRVAAPDGRVSCAAAHRIAADLDVRPSEVGRTLDLLEFRIAKCQLGLFGYRPEKKIVEPAENVSPELREALSAALENDRVPCAAAWSIADRFGMARLEVAAACEAMNLRVSPCQLGAF